MLILGIPDIVVREAVHVGIEPAIGIGIHVHHEASCDRSSVSPPVQSGQVEFYMGPLKSTNLPHQLYIFCLTDTDSLFCKTCPAKFPENIPIQSWHRSRNRDASIYCEMSITKIPPTPQHSYFKMLEESEGLSI